MKTKKFTKLILAVSLAAISVTTCFGQYNDQNNGAECGCPVPVNSRTVVDLATLAVSLNANQ
jgi:hypothetical protein